MKIWLVSMECAGLSEAGGVKDVTYALCDNFAKKDNDVTLFIPFFGCTKTDKIKNLKKNVYSTTVSMCGQDIELSYSTARFSETKAKIVFVEHLAYSEKKAVYVYTEEEEKANPEFVRGTGHRDSHFLDSLLCKAVAAYGKIAGKSKLPDVVHCQDASAAMTPAFMALMKPDFFSETKSVVTIHNAGPAYHHEFRDINEAFYYTELPWNWISEAMNESRVEPFLLASQFAHLTTVSTYYAEEITDSAYRSATDGLSSIFQEKKIRVTGITNGIDYYRYSPEIPEISRLPYAVNPFEGDLGGKLKNRRFFLELCKETDDTEKFAENLPDEYRRYMKDFTRFGFLSPSSDDKKTLYLSYHGRLVWQKGISVLSDALEALLPQMENIRVAIVGQGDANLERRVKELAFRFPGKLVYLKGYNRGLSRLSVAQADFAVFPSDFEPCGLEDFIAQLFGTIPIAHATGGLKKIIDEETGFLYSPNDSGTLCSMIRKAEDLKMNHLKTLKSMATWASNYVRIFYSWQYVSEKYLNLFRNLEP